MSGVTKVAPVVRWAGGKRWLVPHLQQIARVLQTTSYFEPFAGGAAAFFSRPWPKPHLGDVNEELIAMYRGIASNHAVVRRRLKALPVNRETYEIIRTSAPRSDTARAVRMLYLNRLAYGGIYRTDRTGRFNVPYSGDRTTASLWQGDRLEQTARLLEGAVLRSGDFEPLVDTAEAGSFVYCDPVYALPEPERPSPFRRYAPSSFSWPDQSRLANAAHDLKRRGAIVVVSNILDERVTRLFAPDLTVVFDRRAPLPKAGGRQLREALHVIASADIARAIQRVLPSPAPR